MCKVGIYLVCDYPDRNRFLEAVKQCDEFGVDFLEIGIPFSDPTADGDTIERAALEVLEREGMDDFYDALKSAREIFSRKLYVMTYANVVYANGIENFAKRFSFIDGVILADVPFRESKRFKDIFKKYDIGFVHFVTPETDSETLEKIKASVNDFIYFVSIRGTTGGEFTLDEDAIDRLKKLEPSKQDVIVGFGIKTRDDIKKVCEYADGVVIGTEAIKSLTVGRFNEFLGSVVH